MDFTNRKSMISLMRTAARRRFVVVTKMKGITIILILACCSIRHLQAQDFAGPDTVSVQSGELTLKGLLWRPTGNGPFPTVLFCHGSYGVAAVDPVQQTSLLGPEFAKKGYIFLVVFRRGVGLSKGQGENSADLMYNAFKEKGQEERNKIQLQHLETDQLQDMISGLRFLRNRQDTDTNRIAGNRSFLWRITYPASCRA